MCGAERRHAVRDRLLALAAEDPVIAGAAVTGSVATGNADDWSDLDLALGVDDHDLTATLDRWTRIMINEFDAVHHWDLPAGGWVYRVFLLPDLLEVDVGFALAAEWGPRADSWQTIFGDPAEIPFPAPAFDPRTWTGHLWHHLLHARISIERGQGLQAAYWIGAARDLVIESATRRHRLPTAYAKGAHRLPPTKIAVLEATLVGSTDQVALRRALAAMITVATAEIAIVAPASAERLLPALQQAREQVDL